jgi:electron transport complex protein RnfC
MAFASTIPSIKPLSFSHGVHPEEYKELSCDKPVERMPFVNEYILPLSQHIGAPSKPIVKKGQTVTRGEKIAESSGFVSVALHAPVDGTIADIDLFTHPNGQELPAIKIKSDPFSPQLLPERPVKDPESMDLPEFISAIQEAGLVGLGGAAFPAHVKFSIPEDKKCKYFMVNGCECEPFLTADDRLMVEYAEELLDGMEILNRFIKAEKLYIAIEINKPEAIRVLSKKAIGRKYQIEVIPLKVKYPQGAEKMMISAILGKEVPTGKLPLDLEVLVSNVGTTVALSQYFRKGQPLIERVITVTGTAMGRPANVMVPIGTPMNELVEWCGGITDDTARILLGGPMMGMVQKRLDVPVIKGTSGILALTNTEVRDLREYNCIRCSRCIDACPIYLNPSILGLLAKKGLWEEMKENNVLDCFECGSCSFVCPSAIPLVQSFRVAKGFIKEKVEREKVAVDV